MFNRKSGKKFIFLLFIGLLIVAAISLTCGQIKIPLHNTLSAIGYQLGLPFFDKNDFTQEQMTAFLRARAKTRPEKTAGMFLIGLFHRKLSDLWIKLAGISREKRAGDLTDEEIIRLVRQIKSMKVTVSGTNSFEQAQVCCGGVDTAEVDPDTLESLYIPGLYFAGEILDVDGMCGGYNLTFAWASGYIAGKSAAV